MSFGDSVEEAVRLNYPTREPIPLDPLQVAHLACEYAKATGEPPSPMRAIRFWQECGTALEVAAEQEYRIQKAEAGLFPMKLSKVFLELGLKDAAKESATAIFKRFYSWYIILWRYTIHDQRGLSPEYAQTYFTEHPEEGEKHTKFVDASVTKFITEGASRSDVKRWSAEFRAWRRRDKAAIKSAAGGGRRPKKKGARKAAKKKSPQRKK